MMYFIDINVVYTKIFCGPESVSMGGEQVADQHRARELLVLGPGLGPQTLVHRVRDADVGVLVPPAALLALELGYPKVREDFSMTQKAPTSN